MMAIRTDVQLAADVAERVVASLERNYPDKLGFRAGHILDALRAVREDERAACAKICDDLHDEPINLTPVDRYDVGVNVGGLKRCEMIATRIHARRTIDERAQSSFSARPGRSGAD